MTAGHGKNVTNRNQKSNAPNTPAKLGQGLTRSLLSTAKISDSVALHMTVVRKSLEPPQPVPEAAEIRGHVGMNLQLHLRA